MATPAARRMGIIFIVGDRSLSQLFTGLLQTPKTEPGTEKSLEKYLFNEMRSASVWGKDVRVRSSFNRIIGCCVESSLREYWGVQLK